MKRHEEALEMLNKAISENPDDYDLYALKGNVLVHLGEDEQALQAYKDGLSVLQKIRYRSENEYVDDSWGDGQIDLIAGGGFTL
jgi:tetratricopeptide (TPR) repeat protein